MSNVIWRFMVFRLAALWPHITGTTGAKMLIPCARVNYSPAYNIVRVSDGK